MTTLDWFALAFVAVTALAGLRRGLVGTALVLAGVVGGAIIGDRVAPHLLAGGASSPYTPLAALAGAIVGAVLFRSLASLLASSLRNGMRLVPPLRTLDTLGGLVAGALLGLFVVWVLGAVALEFPGQTVLRRDVMASALLQRLNQIAPPTSLLHALDRFDQLPTLLGPAPPSLPSDPAVLSEPAVRAAEPSIVRVTDTACGLGVEGSGWVAGPHLVVTAAHVVAGASGILVDDDPARIFALDRRDDVAVLDVPGLAAPPLRFASPTQGTAVAILGYPENGGFNAQAGRIGPTATTEVNGTPRRVTEFSGLVRPGNSGGPALDAAGVVETTVFARLDGIRAGLGLPARTVASALAAARAPVPAGSCWSA